jgi:hypothetical protein
MHIDPPLLISVSALLGALMGGGASLAAAVYTQRRQHRVQEVARETAKREAVYADFLMTASGLLLDAHVQDRLALGGDEQRLIGLLNRMRLFAPPDVVGEAETVLRAIIEISLRPGVDVGQLARAALSEGLGPDPLLAFSLACRADLDGVRRTMVPAPKAGRRRRLADMSGLLPRRPELIDGPGVRPATADPAWSPGW